MKFKRFELSEEVAEHFKPPEKLNPGWEKIRELDRQRKAEKDRRIFGKNRRAA